MEKLKYGDGGIQLYSGKIFKPLWPDLDSFTMADVAQGLVEAPRFAGHTKYPYKVTQHCVIMARWFINKGMLNEARWALVHENEEGLGFGDLPSPIKYLPEMAGYRALAKVVQEASFRKVGLIGEIPLAVKELDDRMKAAEAKVLQKNVHEWALNIDTSDIVIKPYKNPYYGKKVWLNLFKQLFPNVDIYA